MTHIVLQEGLAKYYLPVIVNQTILNVSSDHLCSAEVFPEGLFSSLGIFRFTLSKRALFPTWCVRQAARLSAADCVGMATVILELFGSSRPGPAYKGSDNSAPW